MRGFLLICVAACLAEICWAQEIRVPASVTAGEEASIATSGSGRATFYLVGPGASQKSDVTLGEDIHLRPEDLRNAGSYLILICSDTCQSATFYVTAAKPNSLTFLVHPSRVPVTQGDAVSGVALPMDQFHNLVLAPVDHQFSTHGGKCFAAVATCSDPEWCGMVSHHVRQVRRHFASRRNTG